MNRIDCQVQIDDDDDNIRAFRRSSIKFDQGAWVGNLIQFRLNLIVIGLEDIKLESLRELHNKRDSLGLQRRVYGPPGRVSLFSSQKLNFNY